MPTSKLSLPHLAANLCATALVVMGIGAVLGPQRALKPFEFQVPASALDRKVVNGLMVIHGTRTIFMGLAVYLTAYFGNRKALGWILFAASAVTFVDGAVCWVQVGKGQWNHWSHVLVLAVVGSMMLGRQDEELQRYNQ